MSKHITVGYLKAYISSLPDDMKVFVAADGCFAGATYLHVKDEKDQYLDGLYICEEKESGSE
jgi:hypothetical protein